jgi:hypothetical protein
MKKFIKLLALAGMAASMLAFAPTASAHGTTTCVVEGRVDLEGPVTNAGTGGKFEFNSTVITCVGDHAGTYNVTAKGTRNAGETCAQAEGSGTLEGTPGITDGQFTYTRDGNVVIVNGTLNIDGVSHTFSAVLIFTADPGQICPVNGVSSASLNGTADIN